MKKKLIIFILFLILPTASIAGIDPYCNNKVDEIFLINLDKLKIKNINIKVDNYRKWTRNSINILIGNFRWIPQKFKKRFSSDITVKFENDLICNFRGRIRHNGDQKDHIALKENSIIQSVDIHLKTGNIYGITKFKLLRPNTRGNFKDEIFLTELLREFNYLAPRTNYVEATINGVSSKMIFQEKATKELLEFNLRREGPIFEGDERFLFRLSEHLPDNQLSNNAIGMLPLLEDGINAMLAKQTNSNWITRSENHSVISYNSLSNLNLTYLLYTNKYKDIKNNFSYSNYTLDNNLLALNDPKNILRLDIYNLIIFATNGWHGLVPNNRKFYWNSIENFFEPINYDSNANIEDEPSVFHLPFSNQIELAFNDLEKLLTNINIKNFSKKITIRGLNLNEQQVEKKINIIKRNLYKLKDIYLKIDPEVIAYNRNNKIKKEMWDKYYKSLYKISPNIYLVKHASKNNLFKRCEIKNLNCVDYSFNKQELVNLVEGDLTKNDKEYQYLGLGTDSNNFLINSKYKKIKFQDTYFYFDENIKYSHDEEKKEFNIFQNKPEARAFFYKGKLKDINVIFYGYKDELKSELSIHPIDQRGLTGCLSMINLNVKNISIKSDKSSCEDAVNLINVEGSLNEINIIDSFRDGLDIDFSKVEINYINIISSKNDCVDLSAGNYKLNKLNLINCGDKGLSIGEKSFLYLNEINIENSNIGIASKDSSISKLNKAHLKNLKTCVSAYNKKQEFYGSFLEIKNMECKNYVQKTDADIKSKIIIENEL